MNILVYKFRPIILSLLEFTLECIATIYMDWGSCPTGGTIVDGKFWYTTTLEGDPDEMYIVVWEDDVNYPDLPYMLYLEVQTPPTDLTAWYEPQQVFKTFVLDGVSITVGVWMYDNLGDDTFYSFRIFNGTTLVYSDDSLSLGHDGWASLNSDFIWISEAGVINLLYSFQENAHVTATRKAYYYNYQSTDGGLTWTSYLIHSHTNTWSSGYSEDLLYITGEGNTLYAELGRKLLFKSTDGGQNWTLVRNDLFPYDYADYDYLSHLFLFKGNLYKCFMTEPGGVDTYGVYKSTDGGYNFTYYPIVSLWPVCSDFAIVGDYVYMAFVSSYTFYYYRSADGETWELVSSDTQSYMRSDSPAFLAVSGDLVAFTTYYMAHRPGGGSTGISARSMITSRDGGLTWDILTTGFADAYYPKGMVRLTWTAPAGSQIEVYRRFHFPDFIGDWTLIDTVPAASSPYTDITSWCEYPNEYKLKIVDGAELGTAFIHTLDAQYYYVVNQITINDGSVYSLSWLKYVTPLRYPSLPITLAHPRLFLILQDGVEYEKIIYHASQSWSVYPTLQFNPTVMMMVGYLPILASIYWLIDGNWQISEIPLRGTSAEYSYYNSTVVRNFTARENGEAVVVLGNYKMTATVASYLDVYYTSDFGQSWTGPIAIWSLSGYAEQPRGDVFKTDDAYYILRWNSSHTDGSVYKSADGITWIGVLYFVSSVAALATESDNFYFAVSVSNIAKLFKEIVGTSSQLTGLNTGSIAVKVSPTYASDSTIMAGISGAMKKSTDGGDTWITINTGLGSPYVYDIGMSNNFASDQTAFAVENAASIAKTTDGVSWTRYTSGITGSLNKVRVSPNFSSDNTVFGMCTDYIKHIYKSTDGGVNWSRSDTGIPASTNWIYCMDISSNFASDGTLFAGGTMDPTTAAMYRTIDGGANWTLKNTGLGTGGYIRSLKISPNYAIDQTVYCGKDTSYGLYKTTDSGNNWSLVYTFEANITSIEISPNFSTDNTLYVTTSNYTWKSTDAGVSWVIISIAFNCSLRYLTVAPSSPVFHGSTLGVFKYTGTLGTCYELINAAISGLGTIYSMCVIGDYINIAGVSQPGGVYVMMHSSDGGLNFSSTLMQHIRFSYYADFSVDGSNITYGGRSASYNTGTPLFISYPGYAISHDYGATWEEVYIDYTHPHDEDEHMIEKIYYF